MAAASELSTPPITLLEEGKSLSSSRLAWLSRQARLNTTANWCCCFTCYMTCTRRPKLSFRLDKQLVPGNTQDLLPRRVLAKRFARDQTALTGQLLVIEVLHATQQIKGRDSQNRVELAPTVHLRSKHELKPRSCPPELYEQDPCSLVNQTTADPFGPQSKDSERGYRSHWLRRAEYAAKAYPRPCSAKNCRATRGLTQEHAPVCSTTWSRNT
jgi:hypothetical protein